MKKWRIFVLACMLAMLAPQVTYAAPKQPVWLQILEESDDHMNVQVATNGTTTDGMISITYDVTKLAIEEDDIVPMTEDAMYSVTTETEGIVSIAYVSDSVLKEGPIFNLSFEKKAECDSKAISYEVVFYDTNDKEACVKASTLTSASFRPVAPNKPNPDEGNAGNAETNNDEAIQKAAAEAAEKIAQALYNLIYAIFDAFNKAIGNGDLAVHKAGCDGIAGEESVRVIVEFQCADDKECVLDRIRCAILGGQEPVIHYEYNTLLNGVSMELPQDEIACVESWDEVAQVLEEDEYAPQSTEDEPCCGATEEDNFVSKYTGMGTKIAVIDTGLDVNHRAFAALSEDKLTENSLTLEDIEEVLPQLNAYKMYLEKTGEELTAEELYYNSKVAFGFNYYSNNTNIATGDQDGHGTKVAGIACANQVEDEDMVGVARDAQVLVLKVFTDENKAYTSNILAALEDAILLKADVINMSLSFSRGYGKDSDRIQEIYGRVREQGIVLDAACGNEGIESMYDPSNPDYGRVSAPASYVSTISVGAFGVPNKTFFYINVNGERFAYDNVQSFVEMPLNELGIHTCAYAVVPNGGYMPEDYADVAGKIAVLPASELLEIQLNMASEAGALALVAYQAEEIVSAEDFMLFPTEWRIPAAIVSAECGESLLSNYEMGQAFMVIEPEGTLVYSQNGPEICDFSSRGATPDLRLGVNLVAPGTNCSTTVSGDSYGRGSGTSMSTPYIAGASAMLVQYMNEYYSEVTGPMRDTMVNSLLLSTAHPLRYNEDLFVSPRWQGSGQINVSAALNNYCYLWSYEGMGYPFAELMDDQEMTGKYAFSFELANAYCGDKYFLWENTSQTEMNFMPIGLDAKANVSGPAVYNKLDFNDDGKISTHDVFYLYRGINNHNYDASQTFRYDLDADGNVTANDTKLLLNYLVKKEALDDQVTLLKVPGNSHITVDVNLEIEDEIRDIMADQFENGCYVEGYFVLKDIEGEETDLTFPYMGYFGDWTKAPIFGEDGLTLAKTNVIGVDGFAPLMLGNNPYQASVGFFDENAGLFYEDFDKNHASVYPGGNGILDTIAELQFPILRNTENFTLVASNAETGEIYYIEEKGRVKKSENEVKFNYAFTDANGNYLANGTKVKITASADLSFDGHEANNSKDSASFYVTVDTEAPEILDAHIEEVDGERMLYVTYRDNVEVAAVILYNEETMEQNYYFADDAGEKEHTQVIPLYDMQGPLQVYVGDYAMNEAFVTVWN